MLLDARIRSENDVAEVYLGRFEAITRRAMNGDPGTGTGTEAVIESLKDRLRDEERRTKDYLRRADDDREKLRETERKMRRKENEFDRIESVAKSLSDRIGKLEEKNSEMAPYTDYKKKKENDQQNEEKQAFLESEVERLREDRGEQKA